MHHGNSWGFRKMFWARQGAKLSWQRGFGGRSMKEFALRLLAGPLLMAVTMLLGMVLGYYVGFIPSCIVLSAVALFLGIQIGKRTSVTVGMIAVVFAALTGVASAFGYHQVRQLESGDFARDVPLADLPRFRTKDRLTLRDGDSRVDLDGYVARVSKAGGASDRTYTTYECEAYPIVPDGWTPSAPVPVWRLGESADLGAPREVFHPGDPSETCRSAIDKAISDHRLTTAKDAVYLNAMDAESDDAGTNRLRGPMALALMGGMWIVVGLLQGLGDAISWWRDRKT
jgi:hypothetical protein